jgi:aminoglycoside N3'-acetyltransferase
MYSKSDASAKVGKYGFYAIGVGKALLLHRSFADARQIHSGKFYAIAKLNAKVVGVLAFEREFDVKSSVLLVC